MLKKISVFLITLCISVFSILMATGQSVSAASSSFEGRTGKDCGNFLGLTSWDCNVNVKDQDSLKEGIWTIAANILTDITVLAAYLVLGYVIYGGYLYIFSSGDAAKVANGKKTLSQAFIGLAIVLLANVILNAIRIALGADFTGNCATDECVGAGEMVSNAIQWVIGITGVVVAIFVIYGGVAYITSSGDPAKLQKAKTTILYALIGLAIVGLAEIITAFVTNMINDSKSTSLINETTISKEVYEKTT